MWIVQVLSTTYTQVLANPTARQRVDRSSPFSSKAYTQILANPTARQRVDRSSPVYSKTYTQESESHITAACGSFKSRLQQDVHPRIRIPHHGSVWIVQILSTARRTPKNPNPTSRQRVDRSSPVYSKSYTQILANPTARQRVDRAHPFLHQAAPRRRRIPLRGSVWIVQVLSTTYT